MSAIPKQFEGVTVPTKANVYFDGKVVSHSVLFPDGSKKTLGFVFPGTYTFNTGEPEKMEIVSGECDINIAGAGETRTYSAGSAFDVPGKSSFEIIVKQGVVEYVCSFLRV